MSELLKKVQEMIDAPHCCAELVAAGQTYLDAVGTTEKETTAREALLAEIDEDLIPIDGLVAFAESEKAEKVFGERAGAFRQHARELKASGALYCDCAACTAAAAVKELLK